MNGMVFCLRKSVVCVIELGCEIIVLSKENRKKIVLRDVVGMNIFIVFIVVMVVVMVGMIK